MEEEEEEEEEGWEEPRGSDATFSKHFNNHPCSPGSGGRRNTTDRNFNSIGLGFGGSARDLERQRQSQTMILQQHQRWSENYDDLKNEKEDTKFFLRQSYTESDFEDDDDDGFYDDEDEDEDELDDSRSYGDPEIRPMHTMTTTTTQQQQKDPQYTSDRLQSRDFCTSSINTLRGSLNQDQTACDLLRERLAPRRISKKVQFRITSR